jgi:uncharacterized protein YjbI with pentapeptide repeats
MPLKPSKITGKFINLSPHPPKSPQPSQLPQLSQPPQSSLPLEKEDVSQPQNNGMVEKQLVKSQIEFKPVDLETIKNLEQLIYLCQQRKIEVGELRRFTKQVQNELYQEGSKSEWIKALRAGNFAGELEQFLNLLKGNVNEVYKRNAMQKFASTDFERCEEEIVNSLSTSKGILKVDWESLLTTMKRQEIEKAISDCLDQQLSAQEIIQWDSGNKGHLVKRILNDFAKLYGFLSYPLANKDIQEVEDYEALTDVKKSQLLKIISEFINENWLVSTLVKDVAARFSERLRGVRYLDNALLRIETENNITLELSQLGVDKEFTVTDLYNYNHSTKEYGNPVDLEERLQITIWKRLIDAGYVKGDVAAIDVKELKYKLLYVDKDLCFVQDQNGQYHNLVDYLHNLPSEQIEKSIPMLFSALKSNFGNAEYEMLTAHLLETERLPVSIVMALCQVKLININDVLSNANLSIAQGIQLARAKLIDISVLQEIEQLGSYPLTAEEIRDLYRLGLDFNAANMAELKINPKVTIKERIELYIDGILPELVIPQEGYFTREDALLVKKFPQLPQQSIVNNFLDGGDFRQEKDYLLSPYLPQAIVLAKELGEKSPRLSNFHVTDEDIKKIPEKKFSVFKFHNVDFSKCNLREANFKGATLVNVGFIEADLKHANFTWATLRNVNFAGANLDGAIFVNAEFSDSNCVGASCNNTDFTEANLKGAIFDEVALKDAILTPSQLDDIVISKDSSNTFVGNKVSTGDDERTKIRKEMLNGQEKKPQLLSQQPLDARRKIIPQEPQKVQDDQEKHLQWSKEFLEQINKQSNKEISLIQIVTMIKPTGKEYCGNVYPQEENFFFSFYPKKQLTEDYVSSNKAGSNRIIVLIDWKKLSAEKNMQQKIAKIMDIYFEYIEEAYDKGLIVANKTTLHFLKDNKAYISKITDSGHVDEDDTNFQISNYFNCIFYLREDTSPEYAYKVTIWLNSFHQALMKNDIPLSYFNASSDTIISPAVQLGRTNGMDHTDPKFYGYMKRAAYEMESGPLILKLQQIAQDTEKHKGREGEYKKNVLSELNEYYQQLELFDISKQQRYQESRISDVDSSSDKLIVIDLIVNDNLLDTLGKESKKQQPLFAPQFAQIVKGFFQEKKQLELQQSDFAQLQDRPEDIVKQKEAILAVARLKTHPKSFIKWADRFKYNKEMWIKAIALNPAVVKYFTSPQVEGVDKIVEGVAKTDDVDKIKKGMANIKDVALRAVLEAPSLLAKIDDPDFTLLVLQRDARAFLYVNEKLLKNEDFLLKACEINWQFFASIGKKYQDDEKFVRQAIALNPWVFVYIPDKFKDDAEIIKKVVDSHPHLFFLFGDEKQQRRNDEKFMRDLISKKYEAFWDLGSELVEDDKIVLKCYEIALKKSPSEAVGYRLALQACKYNPKVFLYFDEKLQKDERFVGEAIKKNPSILDIIPKKSVPTPKKYEVGANINLQKDGFFGKDVVKGEEGDIKKASNIVNNIKKDLEGVKNVVKGEEGDSKKANNIVNDIKKDLEGVKNG